MQPPSEDEVSDALTRPFKDHNVAVDNDSVKVTVDSGLYKLAVRLSGSFNPLPQVHDDTLSLQTGSLQGALYLCRGAVQIIEDQVRVTMRIVPVWRPARYCNRRRQTFQVRCWTRSQEPPGMHWPACRR